MTTNEGQKVAQEILLLEGSFAFMGKSRYRDRHQFLAIKIGDDTWRHIGTEGQGTGAMDRVLRVLREKDYTVVDHRQVTVHGDVFLKPLIEPRPSWTRKGGLNYYRVFTLRHGVPQEPWPLPDGAVVVLRTWLKHTGRAWDFVSPDDVFCASEDPETMAWFSRLCDWNYFAPDHQGAWISTLKAHSDKVEVQIERMEKGLAEEKGEPI